MNHQAHIIDGKKIAQELKNSIRLDVLALEKLHITPGLAVIQIGNNPASTIYVNNKVKAAKELGIHSFVYNLEESCSLKHLTMKIEHLNNDPKVNGILVQLPLPAHIDTNMIINAIAPEKDVDGLTCNNIGKLVTKQEGLVACTPQGCLHLIKTILPELDGLNAVVIGRSNIVGRPMTELLINENCTVTIVHSHSKNIPHLTSQADILVVAVGKAHLIKKEWVKEGAVVIDVGINRVEGPRKLLGDVDFNDVLPQVKAITPVPGGVGPMTIAYLLQNTIKATLMQRHLVKEGDGTIHSVHLRS